MGRRTLTRKGPCTYGARRGVLLLAAGATLAGFVVLLILVATGWAPLHRMDVSVARTLNAWVAPSPALTTFWKAITYALQPLTFEVIAAGTALILWRRAGRRKLAVFVLVAIFGTLALYDLVKVAVGRARPVVPVKLIVAHGASFPSGHAAMSFAAMSLLALLVGRQLRSASAAAGLAVAAATIIASVGFSRLALGVHYLSDVLGGWLLAATWLLCAWAGFDVGAELPAVSRRASPAARTTPDQPRGGSPS